MVSERFVRVEITQYWHKFARVYVSCSCWHGHRGVRHESVIEWPPSVNGDTPPPVTRSPIRMKRLIRYKCLWQIGANTPNVEDNIEPRRAWRAAYSLTGLLYSLLCVWDPLRRRSYHTTVYSFYKKYQRLDPSQLPVQPHNTNRACMTDGPQE